MISPAVASTTPKATKECPFKLVDVPICLGNSPEAAVRLAAVARDPGKLNAVHNFLAPRLIISHPRRAETSDIRGAHAFLPDKHQSLIKQLSGHPLNSCLVTHQLRVQGKPQQDFTDTVAPIAGRIFEDLVVASEQGIISISPQRLRTAVESIKLRLADDFVIHPKDVTADQASNTILIGESALKADDLAAKILTETIRLLAGTGDVPLYSQGAPTGKSVRRTGLGFVDNGAVEHLQELNDAVIETLAANIQGVQSPSSDKLTKHLAGKNLNFAQLAAAFFECPTESPELPLWKFVQAALRK